MVGTLGVAAVLCLLAFVAGGGLNLETLTTVEIGLTLAAAVLIAAATLVAPARRPAYGIWPALLLFAFALLSAISVVWSVQPDESFKDAGRLLAYSAVFAAAVVLARVLPRRWPAVLGGITLAAVVVCGYALLTKSFPATSTDANLYPRLYEPYGYWNAIGLTAAMGAIGCLWLGARRAGHALLSALAYPAMGLMLLTLMLAYSRGALVALALGLALWFCIVPLRLRGAAVLISGALAAGAVVAWDFSRHALSIGKGPDRRATSARAPARRAPGRDARAAHARRRGGRRSDRPQAPSPLTRRRAGVALACLLAVARARLRRRARGQPPRLHRQHLPRLPLADRHARESPEHARAPDGGRQRARALLERGAEGLQGASRCSARARKATKSPACATAPDR